MTRTLPTRLARYLSNCDADDPLLRANQLVDEALALQDAGKFAEAEAVLNEAEALAA